MFDGLALNAPNIYENSIVAFAAIWLPLIDLANTNRIWFCAVSPPFNKQRPPYGFHLVLAKYWEFNNFVRYSVTKILAHANEKSISTQQSILAVAVEGAENQYRKYLAWEIPIKNAISLLTSKSIGTACRLIVRCQLTFVGNDGYDDAVENTRAASTRSRFQSNRKLMEWKSKIC